VSLYARLGADRVLVTQDGPRRAACLDCDMPMLAKAGAVVVWHWAHERRPEDCMGAFEGEWHRQWKILALRGTQEQDHPSGKRRADVLAPGGFAVEFQASSLTGEEVAAREADWGHKLVWIFDAREAYDKDRLRVMGSGGRQRGLFWFKAPERIKAARCPMYYDLGDDGLVQVSELRQEKSSLKGRGWLVSKDTVVADVLRGKKMPVVPHIEELQVKILHLRPVDIFGDDRMYRAVQFSIEGNPHLVKIVKASYMFKSVYWITPETWIVQDNYMFPDFFDQFARHNGLVIKWWPAVDVIKPAGIGLPRTTNV
jgi:hypothetical protein